MLLDGKNVGEIMGFRESCFRALECYNYRARADEKQQNAEAEGKPKRPLVLYIIELYQQRSNRQSHTELENAMCSLVSF